VRKYAVFVRILNGPPELITGMKASVAIQTRLEKDRVQIPVQGVYGMQDRYFCLVKRAENDFESREVKIEGDNSMTVVIKEGLTAGEEVVMNPGEYKDMLVLPDAVLDRAIEMTDEEKKMAEEQLAKAKQQPGGGSRVDELFVQYDSDKDGSLSEAELQAVDERMRMMFSRADANKDSLVSKQELTAAFAAMEQRMREAGGPGGPGGGPGTGGGPGSGGGPGGRPPGAGGGRGPGGGGPNAEVGVPSAKQ
jgi:hypothetical protein